MYGSDLIKTCSVYEGRPPPAFPAPQHSRWSWVGRDSCIRAQQTCVSTVAPLRSAILSNTEQEAAAGTLLKRSGFDDELIAMKAVLWAFCDLMLLPVILKVLLHTSCCCGPSPSAVCVQSSTILQPSTKIIQATATGSVRSTQRRDP